MSIAATAVIFAVSLLPAGARSVGAPETTQSIPYPGVNGRVHIDEPLAHADVYIAQPVFAKQVRLTVTFIPTNIDSLAVGVRENSFWLSYQPQRLYARDQAPAGTDQPITETVTIPLTDKLQEADQSVDVMFFTEGSDPSWELISVQAQVEQARPTWLEVKDYARAILYRERPL